MTRTRVVLLGYLWTLALALRFLCVSFYHTSMSPHHWQQRLLRDGLMSQQLQADDLRFVIRLNINAAMVDSVAPPSFWPPPLPGHKPRDLMQALQQKERCFCEQHRHMSIPGPRLSRTSENGDIMSSAA